MVCRLGKISRVASAGYYPAISADRTGNLSFNYAQMNFGPVMATAAKLAVAEVRTIVDDLLPRERIQLPGVYVDRVVAVS